jgi:hypothetical protein
MPQGRFFRYLLLALPAVIAAASCSVSSDDSSAGGAGTCAGTKCDPIDAGRDQYVADVAVPDAPEAGVQPDRNPLCGEGCLPDDPTRACTGPASDSGVSSDGGGGGGGTDADVDAAPASGDPDAAPPPGAPPPVLGCGVVSKNDEPVSECVNTGTGEIGAPCVSAENCAPGLACVGEGSTGQCRPYCCGDPELCPKDTYCAEGTQKNDPNASLTGDALVIPVCIKADKCKLDEPSPCTGSSCVCKDGTVCAVVREDATTSCVVPGDGQAGDPCPCAGGHVCSQSTKTCLKICSTSAGVNECGSGKCQSVGYLPTGFGVCGLEG